MRVLAIGAHPDDVELGVGGTLAKHADKGDEVYSLILTSGERNGNRRVNESKKSAQILGIKKTFFEDLPDTKVSENSETIEIIERVIEEVRPHRVYTHTTRDSHQDHRNVGKAVVSACRYPKVNQILLFISPWRQVDFNPKVFIDITPFMEKKLNALNFSYSQNNKFYMKSEAVRGLAMYWGYFINSQYAECFEIDRWVEQ